MISKGYFRYYFYAGVGEKTLPTCL